MIAESSGAEIYVRTCTADGGGTHQDSELVRIEHSKSYFNFQRDVNVPELEYAYGTIDVCSEEGCNLATCMHAHHLVVLVTITYFVIQHGIFSKL